MGSEKQRPMLGPGHSPLRHLDILEGDKHQIQPSQPDATELSIELICQLLLQLTVILLCVYLA